MLLSSVDSLFGSQQRDAGLLLQARRDFWISHVVFKSLQSLSSITAQARTRGVARWQGGMRPGKESPVWLVDGSKEEESCAPKQHSLPLL